MKFVAYERTLQGTGASRRLRKTDKVPGIVYGAGTPQMIELDHNALYFALKKEAFHSSLLEMELGGKVQKVLLRDFQMHPWKQNVLHIDFQRVDETTKLRKKVPLHFSGEENSPAVKTDHCLVGHVANEIEIECLAVQLPEFIAVDLSGLTKGASLHALGAESLDFLDVAFRLEREFRIRMPRLNVLQRAEDHFGPGALVQDGALTPAAMMAILRDHLGDIPLAGFFANGEISHDRLYGYTGVLTLFL